jgi:hypothetical protein
MRGLFADLPSLGELASIATGRMAGFPQVRQTSRMVTMSSGAVHTGMNRELCGNATSGGNHLVELIQCPPKRRSSNREIVAGHISSALYELQSLRYVNLSCWEDCPK